MGNEGDLSMILGLTIIGGIIVANALLSAVTMVF